MPNLPWNLLLNQLPTVMRAVDTLIDTTQRRNAERDTTPKLESLAGRATALEDQQRVSADLLKQLAEHIGAVEMAAAGLSAQLRRVLIVASIATVLSLIGIVIGVLLWARG
jgi:hypothetical protein